MTPRTHNLIFLTLWTLDMTNRDDNNDIGMIVYLHKLQYIIIYTCSTSCSSAVYTTYP